MSIYFIEKILLPGIYFFLFFAAFIIIILMLNRFHKLAYMQRRIGHTLHPDSGKKQHWQESLRHFVKQQLEVTTRFFKRTPYLNWSDLTVYLEKAGYYHPYAVTLFLVTIMATFFLMLLLWIGLNHWVFQPMLNLNLHWAWIIATPLFTQLLLKRLIQRRIQWRQQALLQSLPDAISLLSIYLTTGTSHENALSQLAKSLRNNHALLARELQMTASELHMHPDRKVAWQNLVKRTRLPAIHSLVQTLLQSEKFGTPIEKTLQNHAANLRDERLSQVEKKAAKLPVLLTLPLIVFFVPILFIITLAPAVIRILAF